MKRMAVFQVAALAVLLAACGSTSHSPSPGSSGGSASGVGLSTDSVSGLGIVLANAQGRTLYTFAPDKAKKVTCTGSCATFWPPLKKPSGKLRAGGTAKTSLLGSDKNPSGGRVVTYSKWPLYTYSGDNGAGQANGQALKLEGGKWYVISAKGRVIKHSASSGGGPSTGGGGGWG